MMQGRHLTFSCVSRSKVLFKGARKEEIWAGYLRWPSLNNWVPRDIFLCFHDSSKAQRRAKRHITHLLSYPMHHDWPTQPCFHTFTMRVKACTHGCLWATSLISLSIHTLGLGRKRDENKHGVNVLSGLLIKEPTDRHRWWNKRKTDRWIELYVFVNTVMWWRLYPCWGEWLLMMSVLWYFEDLRGTLAELSELRGMIWQISRIRTLNSFFLMSPGHLWILLSEQILLTWSILMQTKIIGYIGCIQHPKQIHSRFSISLKQDTEIFLGKKETQ